MSWASKRTTTRGEDIAYCLLGIFDVNMPLLFGEGQQKAFHRLQELVFRQYDDQSLLAWTDQSDGGLMGYARGWMANHPVEFSGAGSIVSIAHPLQNYVVTERGLQISLRILEHNGKEYAVLYCHDESTLDGPLAIHVLPRNNGPIRDGDMVLRYGKPMPFENIEDLDTRSIFIPRHPSVVLTDQHSGQPIRFLRFKGWSPLLELVSAQPSNGLVEDSRTLKLEDFSNGNHRGAMCFHYKPKSMRIVVCVNVFQRNTIHVMINHDEYGSDEQILENMDEENTEYLGRYRPWTEYEQLMDQFSGNGVLMSVNVKEVHVQNNTIGEVTIEI